MFIYLYKKKKIKKMNSYTYFYKYILKIPKYLVFVMTIFIQILYSVSIDLKYI